MDPWLLTWADYYEDLGLSPSASSRVIQAAYRAMARDFHSDSGANADAERMKQINTAYEVLSDAGKKLRYDHTYHSRQQRQTSDPGSQPAPPSSGSTRSATQPPTSSTRSTRGASPSSKPPAQPAGGGATNLQVFLVLFVIATSLMFCAWAFLFSLSVR